MIPYGRQDITDDDIAAVENVLRSDFLTQGPQVRVFEDAIERYCSVHHAVAVNSATSALHIACLALGLGPGDILWTSPITFVASANCGRYCGAAVDFVDIDEHSINMSPAALKKKLKAAKRSGRLPKVLVVVHFSGHSADMETICKLARQYGVRIIEDASHAIGGRYKDKPVGACLYSDITVFSLHPVKIITSAEGGLAVTNDLELSECMRRLRSHGITREAGKLVHDDAPWYYEQHELGLNYRLPDVLAALGNSQLNRLDTYVDRRHEIADRYDELLKDLPLIVPVREPSIRSALHIYVVQLDRDKTDISRRKVFEHLRAAGIGVQIHYIPVHLQPYYRAMGFGPGDFRAAETYYEQALTIPLFPALSNKEQDETVAALRYILCEADGMAEG